MQTVTVTIPRLAAMNIQHLMRERIVSSARLARKHNDPAYDLDQITKEAYEAAFDALAEATGETV